MSRPLDVPSPAPAHQRAGVGHGTPGRWRWVAGAVIVAALAVAGPGATVASAHAPHDEVSDVAVVGGSVDDGTVFAVARARLMRSTDGGETWTEVVRGLGHEVLARIVVSPTDDDTMFLSSRGGGIFRSTDGGESWVRSNEGLTDLRLQEVAVSPTTPGVVLVAGGIGGLHRSTDSGRTWTRILSAGRTTALTFLADGRAVLGDHSGAVFVSDDDGETWDRTATVDDGAAVTSVTAGSSSAPDVVLIGTAAGEVLRSDDRAATFSRTAPGLPEEAVVSLAVAPDERADRFIWASMRDSGVHTSTDGGRSWRAHLDGLTTDEQADEHNLPQFRAVRVVVDEAGVDVVLLGGFDGLFRSDGGGRWRELQTSADYIAGLAVSPAYPDDGTVAVSTYVKGAYFSRDGGERWEAANEGLEGEQGPGNKFAPLRRLHNVVFSPAYADDGTLFTASWTSLLRSNDRGATWESIQVAPRDPDQPLRQYVLAVSPSFADDRTMFIGDRQGEIHRSDRGGDAGSWSLVGDVGGRVRSVVVNADYPTTPTIYVSTVEGVFTSDDHGVTWEPTGPRAAVAPQGTETDPAPLLAASPAYADDGTVFAGTDRGLFVTRDAGATWTRVGGPHLSAESYVEAVAVSPGFEADGTVLVSVREAGLLRSTDGGATFSAVATDLLEANLLVADYHNPTSSPLHFSPGYADDRTVFGYGGRHVIRSTDGGLTWAVLDLPSGAALLESLGFQGAGSHDRASGGARVGDAGRGFDTPVGTLSLRRVAAAAGVGLVVLAGLSALVRGRSRRDRVIRVAGPPRGSRGRPEQRCRPPRRRPRCGGRLR